MSAKIIDNNHVFVSLVKEDEKLFTEILRNSPFQATVRPEDLHATILYSLNPIIGAKLKPELVHNVVIRGAEVWFDPVLKIRDLVLTLDAPTLIQRQHEIMKTTGAVSAYENYQPNMVLVFNMPDYTKQTKWFTNELLNKFNNDYRGSVIRFSEEAISSTDTGIFVNEADNSQALRVNHEITQGDTGEGL